MTLLDCLLKINGKFSTIAVFDDEFLFEVNSFNATKEDVDEDNDGFELSIIEGTLELKDAETIIFTDDKYSYCVSIPANTEVSVETNCITVEEYKLYFFDEKDLSFLNN